MKECSLLNGSFIPALPAYEYGGYIISAWARPEFKNGLRQLVLFTSRANSDLSSRFKELRASCSKVKSRLSSRG